MTMLMRCQLHIEKELALADRFDDTAAPPVPGSLIDSQWIERAERIARFCADMTALFVPRPPSQQAGRPCTRRIRISPSNPPARRGG